MEQREQPFDAIDEAMNWMARDLEKTDQSIKEKLALSVIEEFLCANPQFREKELVDIVGPMIFSDVVKNLEYFTSKNPKYEYLYAALKNLDPEGEVYGDDQLQDVRERLHARIEEEDQ